VNDVTIICILGMHRSGTSVLARVLNLLGVYLGPPDRLMPAAPENPRGFWEHLDITRLNDALLGRLGGTALDPAPVEADPWDGPQFSDLRQAAVALLRHDFADANMWGWKDPRTCLTLPFWQRLLPPMRYVLTLRQPFAVVHSLERRDRLTVEQALHLWLSHVQLALRHTKEEPRCLVFYEDLLVHWRDEVPRLAAFIGEAGKAECPEARAAIAEFVDLDLQHHRTASTEAIEGNRRGDTTEAARLAQSAYDVLHREGLARAETACAMIEHALKLLAPEVARQAALRREAVHRHWSEALQALRTSLAELVPHGSRFILADEAQTGLQCPDREAIPFLERDGMYWGSPVDDGTAVRELERLRHSRAALIAFAWPAFWWLDYYTGLHTYLRSNFRCVREDQHLIAFQLG